MKRQAQRSTISVIEDLTCCTIRVRACAQFGVINSCEKLIHGEQLLYTIKVRLAGERAGCRVRVQEQTNGIGAWSNVVKTLVALATYGAN